jgi:hypothetical protein
VWGAVGLSPNVVTLATLRAKGPLAPASDPLSKAIRVPDAEIQKILGHARVSLETRRYITPVGSRDHMDSA